ncbi:hypothetical protein Misp02_67860 [Microtetraspora sp. NBRC 16547]|nr:hypothetical protein Misp02_67860 [Microtetraspora sp. NBRC 16547]
MSRIARTGAAALWEPHKKRPGTHGPAAVSRKACHKARPRPCGEGRILSPWGWSIGHIAAWPAARPRLGRSSAAERRRTTCSHPVRVPEGAEIEREDFTAVVCGGGHLRPVGEPGDDKSGD